MSEEKKVPDETPKPKDGPQQPTGTDKARKTKAEIEPRKVFESDEGKRRDTGDTVYG